MRHGRIDANQPEIVKYLRSAGVVVAITSNVGSGFPDIVCGYRGVNYAFEIKDGAKPPCERKLTKDEKKWHGLWRGQVDVILDAYEAMRIMGMI